MAYKFQKGAATLDGVTEIKSDLLAIGADADVSAANIVITAGVGDTSSTVDGDIIVGASGKIELTDASNGKLSMTGGSSRIIFEAFASSTAGRLELGTDNTAVPTKVQLRVDSGGDGEGALLIQSEASNTPSFEMGVTPGLVNGIGSGLMNIDVNATFNGANSLTCAGNLTVVGGTTAASTAVVQVKSMTFCINHDAGTGAGSNDTGFFLGKIDDSLKGAQVMFRNAASPGSDTNVAMIEFQGAGAASEASGIAAIADFMYGSGAGLTNVNAENSLMLVNHMTNQASDAVLDAGLNLINEGNNRSALTAEKVFQAPQVSGLAVGDIVRIVVMNNVTDTNCVKITKYSTDTDVVFDGATDFKIQSPSGSVELVYLGSSPTGLSEKKHFAIL